MKVVFPPIDSASSSELSFEMFDDGVDIWIDDREDMQNCRSIRIDFEEAREIVKYLEERLPK